MRSVIQRVRRAKVEVKGEVVGEIGEGLFILLGVGKEDTQEDADKLVEKLLKLRIMADSHDKMNLSVMETTKEVLVVSQFTLYADMRKGNRPSFVKAASPDKARDLYKYFVGKLVERGVRVATGEFGEYMEIEAKLDGPVTIVI
jgi:D-tyrosyl-tRNA(Tyr) deacylase